MTSTSNDSTTVPFTAPTFSPTLIKSIKDFQNIGLFSDVTLIVENENFSAHKLILAGASAYFLKLFQKEFEEQSDSKSQITNLKSETSKNLRTTNEISTTATAADSDQVSQKNEVKLEVKKEIGDRNDHENKLRMNDDNQQKMLKKSQTECWIKQISSIDMMTPEEKNSKLQPTRIINAEKSDDDENDTSEVNIHDTPSNSSSGSPIIDTNEHNFVNVNVEHENGMEIESNSPLKSSGISNSSKSNSLSKLLNNSSSNSSSNGGTPGTSGNGTGGSGTPKVQEEKPEFKSKNKDATNIVTTSNETELPKSTKNHNDNNNNPKAGGKTSSEIIDTCHSTTSTINTSNNTIKHIQLNNISKLAFIPVLNFMYSGDLYVFKENFELIKDLVDKLEIKAAENILEKIVYHKLPSLYEESIESLKVKTQTLGSSSGLNGCSQNESLEKMNSNHNNGGGCCGGHDHNNSHNQLPVQVTQANQNLLDSVSSIVKSNNNNATENNQNPENNLNSNLSILDQFQNVNLQNLDVSALLQQQLKRANQENSDVGQLLQRVQEQQQKQQQQQQQQQQTGNNNSLSMINSLNSLTQQQDHQNQPVSRSAPIVTTNPMNSLEKLMQQQQQAQIQAQQAQQQAQNLLAAQQQIQASPLPGSITSVQQQLNSLAAAQQQDQSNSAANLLQSLMMNQGNFQQAQLAAAAVVQQQQQQQQRANQLQAQLSSNSLPVLTAQNGSNNNNGNTNSTSWLLKNLNGSTSASIKDKKKVCNKQSILNKLDKYEKDGVLIYCLGSGREIFYHF